MITDPELIAQYSKIHESGKYGASSIRDAPYILPYMQQAGVKSILDYGCGRSKLADYMNLDSNLKVDRYDPSIEEYKKLPTQKYDVVVSIDVLEHIPEQDIDNVLLNMYNFAPLAFLVIDTKLATTILPDGRNAHLTVRPFDWWQAKVRKVYGIANAAKSAKSRRAVIKTWDSSLWDDCLWNARHRVEKLRFSRWKYRSQNRLITSTK